MASVRNESDVSGLFADAAWEQTLLTKEAFERGETWTMAPPYRFFFKSALRLHAAFLPVFLGVTVNRLWIVFTLPLIMVLVFLYARLIRSMRAFSLRADRLWLVFWLGNAVTAAEAWGIVVLLRALLSGSISLLRIG